MVEQYEPKLMSWHMQVVLLWVEPFQPCELLPQTGRSRTTKADAPRQYSIGQVMNACSMMCRLLSFIRAHCGVGSMPESRDMLLILCPFVVSLLVERTMLVMQLHISACCIQYGSGHLNVLMQFLQHLKARSRSFNPVLSFRRLLQALGQVALQRYEGDVEVVVIDSVLQAVADTRPNPFFCHAKWSAPQSPEHVTL